MALQNIADRLIRDLMPQIGQLPHNPIMPQDRFSSAMRTINSSTSLSIRGRPGVRRFCEPSNLRATIPAGAVAGWGLHPLESAAFSRRTPISDIGRPHNDLCLTSHPARSGHLARKRYVGHRHKRAVIVFCRASLRSLAIARKRNATAIANNDAPKLIVVSHALANN